MEESTSGSIFSKMVLAIFVLAIVDLAFINWWILKRSGSAVSLPAPDTTLIDKVTPTPTASPTPSESEDEEKSTTERIIVPVPTPSASKNSGSLEEVVVQTPNKEIFIPMGSGKTNSNVFADLYGVEVTIDTTKYFQIDYVAFEGSVWVENGNGRGWAQIKNVTDNNPLIESQISNPTSTPTLKTSGHIPVPNGSKTYRVQAKTELDQYAAHIENARLKIVLK